MKPLAKAGLIASGYLLAAIVAAIVVAVHVAMTNGPDRQGSGGMYAFGDSLTFLVAFAVAAVPPTGAALYFLRPNRRFWQVLSIGALSVALTGAITALTAYVAPRTADMLHLPKEWLSLAPLRVIVAPLFVLLFVLCGFFAPNRSSRIALIVATAIEAVSFTSVAVVWFHSYLSP